jgi:hypothetical protein
VSIIEDFFREIDDRWSWTAPARVPLRLIGSTALLLQTEYERGTRDSDVLETAELSQETKERLNEIAGAGSDIHIRRRLYLEIVPNGLPFLAWPAIWRSVDALNGALRNFEVYALDVVDVVVSKLKRLNANDLADIAAMVDLDLVSHQALIHRFRSAVDCFSADARADDLPKYVANLHRIERDLFDVAESEIELPSWIG